jgi:very-short-patch-repair endonuclease
MLKEKFLKDKKCKVCGLEFNKNSDNENYRTFGVHIKNEHKLTNEEYYLKYILSGVPVLCACGCGAKTKYHKGKYFKYFSNHKNKTKPSECTVNKILKTKKEQNDVLNLINKTNLTLDDLKNSYHSFINLEKPISVLSKELFIDFRTLKSYWLKLGLIDNLEIFKRICLQSKTKWMVNPIIPNDNVVGILKDNLFLVKKELENKNKLTFNEIISLVGVDINKNYLSFFLKENLTSSELKKIKFIKNSQIELDFLNVLKFYFGKTVEHGFSLENKNFDYKLGKKILIELDGEYWHSKEEVKNNDTIKNKIAKDNCYLLIRVSDKHVKKIEFINKLKKKYNEFNQI